MYVYVFNINYLYFFSSWESIDNHNDLTFQQFHDVLFPRLILLKASLHEHAIVLFPFRLISICSKTRSIMLIYIIIVKLIRE